MKFVPSGALQSLLIGGDTVLRAGSLTCSGDKRLRSVVILGKTIVPCRSQQADGQVNEERQPEARHQSGEVSEKCGGTEPIPVDSRPERVTTLGSGR
jgi:hypothetical protein